MSLNKFTSSESRKTWMNINANVIKANIGSIDTLSVDNLEVLELKVGDNNYTGTLGTSGQVLTLIDNQGNSEFKDTGTAGFQNSSLGTLIDQVSSISTTVKTPLVEQLLPQLRGNIQQMTYNFGDTYTFTASGNYICQQANSLVFRFSLDGGNNSIVSNTIPIIGASNGYWQFNCNFSVKDNSNPSAIIWVLSNFTNYSNSVDGYNVKQIGLASVLVTSNGLANNPQLSVQTNVNDSVINCTYFNFIPTYKN